ncbi:hypothetical protein [Nodularia sphaerocarpa]|uniref:hypothetical protein n=1 Tax=Nodularia sphaerocarpa TaxID=137816 RepID=UPI001EFBEB17|nr:hypothetical protein [Nodularia sphaerocarpa]MDB9372806.1 hypothetical protein [Nodularia sphaerocarpa CS-585]ULP74152.1 hypothetical protein BDGGKGIB_03815 [Nodularia sphaerocarpa UHCC 0038]
MNNYLANTIQDLVSALESRGATNAEAQDAAALMIQVALFRKGRGLTGFSEGITGSMLETILSSVKRDWRVFRELNQLSTNEENTQQDRYINN